MTQSTPNACSSHDSKSSDETQKMPNTGMHMGPWRPQPYDVPPNATHGATPPYAPIAPSSGVGAGLPNHAFQAGPDGHLPPPVADASGGNSLPQHPPMPFLYKTFPSAPFPAPPPFVAQASGSSVGKKRAAEDLEERDAKRTKTTFSKIQDDPLFKPVLNQLGQFTGTYVCAKDRMVLYPESYRKHIKTRKHLGYKLVKFECPVCFKTFSRIDSCKRHYFDRLCGRLAAASGRAPPSFLASEASTSSASGASTSPDASTISASGVSTSPAPDASTISASDASTISASGASTISASDAPATVPAVPFTYAHPNPMFAASMPAVVDPKLGSSQPSEAGVVAEPAADDEGEKDDTDFLAGE